MEQAPLASGLPGYEWWQTLHLTQSHLEFYDRQLNPNVGWARHALAIDEHRADLRLDQQPGGSDISLPGLTGFELA